MTSGICLHLGVTCHWQQLMPRVRAFLRPVMLPNAFASQHRSIINDIIVLIIGRADRAYLAWQRIQEPFVWRKDASVACTRIAVAPESRQQSLFSCGARRVLPLPLLAGNDHLGTINVAYNHVSFMTMVLLACYRRGRVVPLFVGRLFIIVFRLQPTATTDTTLHYKRDRDTLYWILLKNHLKGTLFVVSKTHLETYYC